MLYIRSFLMVLALAGAGFTAGAQEVYKSVNKDGVIEFSDTPTPDSREIEVHPNVVEVAPAPSVTPPPETSANEPAAEAPRQPAEAYGEAYREPEEEFVRREIHEEKSEHPAQPERVNTGGHATGNHGR
jgi:hypothetical protein